MVEVYSTNVENQHQANLLLQHLGALFPAYEINFDLEDCDNILRVESAWETIDKRRLSKHLKHLGVVAQVLSDLPPCPAIPVATEDL
ncbi:hypothetical protein CLV98_104116 [Dyadobacter jejuensis]|uniref:Uncharacterized protein n=1 Tax=Dyadobacter jejuensis TaxID=1082580 RepID=A0A316ALI5_9BACT|nr:hypothetical protein [Dyadobacter jejuensis]PWJ58258.1 hypothetical protein CLV98_104116 [Dyadobacter jejuensis]